MFGGLLPTGTEYRSGRFRFRFPAVPAELRVPGIAGRVEAISSVPAKELAPGLSLPEEGLVVLEELLRYVRAEVAP
jgi:hypothetical protein